MDSLLEVERPNYGGRVALVAAVVLTVTAIGWSWWTLSGMRETAQRRVIDVSLVRIPPPEKPLEKPPEAPAVKKEEIKLDEPIPQPEAKTDEPPPASDRLNLDTDQTGDGRGFGIGPNKGGQDITLGGSGITGANVRWYVDVLQRHFNAELNKNTRLRSAVYRAEIWVWLTAAGAVRRIELAQSTGDPRIDDLLKQALAATPPLSRSPPFGMEQPVRMRVTSHGTSQQRDGENSR